MVGESGKGEGSEMGEAEGRGRGEGHISSLFLLLSFSPPCVLCCCRTEGCTTHNNTSRKLSFFTVRPEHKRGQRRLGRGEGKGECFLYAINVFRTGALFCQVKEKNKTFEDEVTERNTYMRAIPGQCSLLALAEWHSTDQKKKK